MNDSTDGASGTAIHWRSISAASGGWVTGAWSAENGRAIAPAAHHVDVDVRGCAGGIRNLGKAAGRQPIWRRYASANRAERRDAGGERGTRAGELHRPRRLATFFADRSRTFAPRFKEFQSGFDAAAPASGRRFYGGTFAEAGSGWRSPI